MTCRKCFKPIDFSLIQERTTFALCEECELDQQLEKMYGDRIFGMIDKLVDDSVFDEMAEEEHFED